MHTMEYYSALKKILPLLILMNLEDIMLSDVSQSQDELCMIPLSMRYQNRQTLGRRAGWWLTGVE